VHGYLVAELLGARGREGRYGGPYENRTRFLKACVSDMRQALARTTWVASRLTVLEPSDYPYGWGVAACEGAWQPDLAEPLRLIGELTALGVPLHNISMGYPRFQPYLNRPHDRALAGCPPPPEDPLRGVVRFQETVRSVRRAAGGGAGHHSRAVVAAPSGAAGRHRSGAGGLVRPDRLRPFGVCLSRRAERHPAGRRHGSRQVLRHVLHVLADHERRGRARGVRGARFGRLCA